MSETLAVGPLYPLSLLSSRVAPLLTMTSMLKALLTACAVLGVVNASVLPRYVVPYHVFQEQTLFTTLDA